VIFGTEDVGFTSVVGKKRLKWPVAVRYRVKMMLKGSVKTGRSNLLKMEFKALEITGLKTEESKG
jgi:hypothetical protein